MIGAADTLPPAGRIQPIYLEGKLLPVAAPVAHDLGLQDGQVIQAAVSANGSDLSLLLKGQSIDVPVRLADQFVPGQSIWLRVNESAAGIWNLTPLPESASTNESPGTLNLISQLLFRPASDEVEHLMSSGLISQMLQSLDRPDLKTQWRSLQLSMAQLHPDALRTALMGAMGHEVWLSRGRINPGPDPKHFLRSLLNSLDSQAGDSKVNSTPIRQAIDALESNQVQALQAQTQNELMFTLTLPFADANPATLVFKRSPKQEGQPPVITVHAHSQSVELGPVWLQTRLTGKDQVDLIMWAQMQSVVTQAQARQTELGHDLQQAGLRLTSFQIIHGARPKSEPQWSPSGRGLVVDVRA